MPGAAADRACPGLTVAQAYSVQRTNTGLRPAAGERIVGRRVGLTSLPMQRQFGVGEPDFGVLFASMVHRSARSQRASPSAACEGLIRP